MRPRTRPQELGPGHWRIDDLGQGGDRFGHGGTFDRVEECYQENAVRIEHGCLVEESIVSQWRDDNGDKVPADIGVRLSPRGSDQWNRWVDGDDNIRSTPLPLNE